MAKRNIKFNNNEYLIEESKFDPAVEKLINYFSTELAGTGVTLTIGGVKYSLDGTKVGEASNVLADFATDNAGTGHKMSIGGTGYEVSEASLANAVGVMDECLVGLAQVPASQGLELGINSDGTGYRVWGIGSCTDTDIVIPATHNNLPVVEISSYAFQSNRTITSIVCPPSVQQIGEESCAYCRNLRKIEATNPNLRIDYQAFCECDKLEEVIIGGNPEIDPTAFADTAYYNNEENWEGGALYIGNCLYKVSNPVSGVLTVREGTTRITERAAAGCNLSVVNMANNALTIGERAFYNCGNLSTIEGYSNVKGVGRDAFKYTAYYNNTENWINGVLYVADILCQAQTTLTGECSIRIGTKVIGDGAFWGCSEITGVTIPDSVTNIGDYAFYDCSGLTSVMIGNGVTSIGYSAFTNCSGLTSIEIPNSVMSIDYGAFAYCSGLTSVTIGNGVTSIGESAFSGCSRLTSIIVNSNNLIYQSIDGNLYSKGGKTLIKYAIGKTDESFTIPSSVTNIGKDAFAYCVGLVSLTIGNNVTKIEPYALFKCTSMLSITFNGTVEEWEKIDKDNDRTWSRYIPATYVQCIDGRVEIPEYVEEEDEF